MPTNWHKQLNEPHQNPENPFIFYANFVRTFQDENNVQFLRFVLSVASHSYSLSRFLRNRRKPSECEETFSIDGDRWIKPKHKINNIEHFPLYYDTIHNTTIIIQLLNKPFPYFLRSLRRRLKINQKITYSQWNQLLSRHSERFSIGYCVIYYGTYYYEYEYAHF